MMMMMAFERRASQTVVRRGRRAEHVVVLVLCVELDRVLVLVRRHVHHRVVGPGHVASTGAHTRASAYPAGAHGPGAAVPGRQQRRWYVVIETITAVVAQVLVDLGRHVEHARQHFTVLSVIVVVILVDRVSFLGPFDEQHLGQDLDEQFHYPRSHFVCYW